MAKAEFDLSYTQSKLVNAYNGNNINITGEEAYSKSQKEWPAAMAGIMAVRREIDRRVLRQYKVGSTERAIVRSFCDVAPFLDEIFLAELKHGKGLQGSWMEINPEAARGLIAEVNRIKAEAQSKKEYRPLCDHEGVYLNYLDALVQMAYADKPKDFKTLEKRMWKMSYEMYQLGLPTIISTFEVYLDDTAKKSKYAEPMTCLYKPSKDPMTMQMLENMDAVIQAQFGKKYPRRGIRGMFFEDCLNGAAWGIFILSTGFNTNREGFVMWDLFKSLPYFRRVAALAETKLDDSEAQKILRYFYLTHEVMHGVKRVGDGQRVEELARDAPGYANPLKEIRDGNRFGIDIKKYILGMAAECCYNASQRFREEGTDRKDGNGNIIFGGYEYSAYVIMNCLTESGVIKAVGERIEVYPENINKLLWRLDKITRILYKEEYKKQKLPSEKLNKRSRELMKLVLG